MLAAPSQAVDERVLPFAPEQTWPVLADVAASPRWWPAAGAWLSCQVEQLGCPQRIISLQESS